MSDIAVLLNSTLSPTSTAKNATRLRPPWLSYGVVSGATRIGYCFIIVLSALVSQRYITGSYLDVNLPQLSFIMASAAQSYFMATSRLQNHRYADVLLLFLKLTAYWCTTFIVFTILIQTTTLRQFISLTWITTWFLCGLFLLLIASVLSITLLSRWRRTGLLATTIVVIGAGDVYEHLIADLRQSSDDSIRLASIFTITLEPLQSKAANDHTTDNQERIRRFVQSNQIDQIIVALPWCPDASIQVWLTYLITLPSDVFLCPPIIPSWSSVPEASSFRTIPLLKISERPLLGWKYIRKAIEDRLLGLVFLALSWPAMAVIAILIKLDSPGPIFFRQTRYGYNNSLIEVLKFRTMRTTAADTHNETIIQATRFDRRVTRVGYWLRRTSLDELPQLFNVINGQMSLVGPRPHAVAHNEKYQTIVAAYPARHRVKPGITGWAQINGYRGETDTDEKMIRRVEYDLYYIDHWSLRFDLWIIARTVCFGFLHPNAY